jgi:hypothetical protein
MLSTLGDAIFKLINTKNQPNGQKKGIIFLAALLGWIM